MLSEVLPEARLGCLFPEVLIGEHRGTPLGKPNQELMQVVSLSVLAGEPWMYASIGVLKYWGSIEVLKQVLKQVLKFRNCKSTGWVVSPWIDIAPHVYT